MSRKPIVRIQLFTDESQKVDVAGHADRLLSEICAETGLEPFAVLTAGLVLLKLRQNSLKDPQIDGRRPRWW